MIADGDVRSNNKHAEEYKTTVVIHDTAGGEGVQ